MVQIYLDEESREMLKRIKLENANFKLSNYIQMAISNYYGKNIESIDDIKNKIAENRDKILLLNQEISAWEKRIDEIVQQKTIEEQREREIEKEDMERQKIMNFWLNATSEVKKEYNEGLKAGKYYSTTQFAKIKLKDIESQSKPIETKDL